MYKIFHKYLKSYRSTPGVEEIKEVLKTLAKKFSTTFWLKKKSQVNTSLHKDTGDWERNKSLQSM